MNTKFWESTKHGPWSTDRVHGPLSMDQVHRPPIFITPSIFRGSKNMGSMDQVYILKGPGFVLSIKLHQATRASPTNLLSA